MALRRMHKGYQVSVTRLGKGFCYELAGKGKHDGAAKCGFGTHSEALAAGKRVISGKR